MDSVNLSGRVSAISIALVIFCGVAIADDQCLKCHEAIGDNPSTLFKHDIHFRKGVSCADCHGGNPNLEDQDK